MSNGAQPLRSDATTAGPHDEMRPKMVGLVGKLAEVMGEVDRIPKSGYNDFHRYSYATEADIVAAVRTGLASRGVMILPSVREVAVEAIARQGKEPMRLARTTVEYTLTDGIESIVLVGVGEGSDSGDKAVYKALTGALKYALLKLFLIPTGDDPETEQDGGKAKRTGRPNLGAAKPAAPVPRPDASARAATAPSDTLPADPTVSAAYQAQVAGLRGVSSRPHLLRHINKHRPEWRALPPSEQSALRSVLADTAHREGFESVADAITSAEALAAQDASEGSQAAPRDDDAPPPAPEDFADEIARVDAQIAALLARKREELAAVTDKAALLRFYAANCDGRSGLPPAEALMLSVELARRAHDKPFGLAGEPGLRRLAREAGLLS